MGVFKLEVGLLLRDRLAFSSIFNWVEVVILLELLLLLVLRTVDVG